MVVRRHGIAPPAEGDAEAREGTTFFPNHLLRSFMVSTVVLAVTVTLAALFPRPIGDPAAPFELPRELVSTWIVVDVSLALIRYFGTWGFVLFTVLGLTLAFLPLFDRRPERRLRRRPIATAVGLVFFLGFVGAWALGRHVRSLPPGSYLVPGAPARADTTNRRPLPELGPEPQRATPPDAREGGGPRP